MRSSPGNGHVMVQYNIRHVIGFDNRIICNRRLLVHENLLNNGFCGTGCGRKSIKSEVRCRGHDPTSHSPVGFRTLTHREFQITSITSACWPILTDKLCKVSVLRHRNSTFARPNSPPLVCEGRGIAIGKPKISIVTVQNSTHDTIEISGPATKVSLSEYDG
jgi:hypothetical protein